MAQYGVPEESSQAPQLVLWEAARDAETNPRWRNELSTLEAMRLLNEVRCFGRIAFQFVGRPLRRADTSLLIEHGARIGLSLRLAPGADPFYAQTASDLRDAGLARVVLSADLRPELLLLEEVSRARSVGLGVHVSTTVLASGDVADRLAERGSALAEAGVHVWTLVFPNEGGPRGPMLDNVLRKVVTLAPELSLHLEVAGAPQLHRVLAECGADPELVGAWPAEGSGLLYVAADGSVLPAPDFPLVVGNVRDDDIGDVFRDAPVLCALRDRQRLRGKCSRCEFVYLCGGNRARAHAGSGDWLAPDPACSHQPAAGSGADRRAVGASS